MNVTFEEMWVRALLRWDKPQLAGREVPAAVRAFVDLLELNDPEPRLSEDDSVLSHAVRGLQADLTREPEIALEHYAELLDRGDPWLALLAQSLKCWSSEAPQDWIVHSVSLARPILSEEELSQHLARSALQAWDRGYRELAVSLLHESRDAAASVASPRADALRSFLWYLGEREVAPSIVWSSGDLDVDQPWITTTAWNSVSEYLHGVAEAEAGRVYHRILGGSSGLDPVARGLFSAEIQAIWAGSASQLWRVRRDLASYLLSKREKSEEEAQEALALWVLAVGRDIEGATEAAEASFTTSTASELITTGLHRGRRVPHFQDYIECVSALWDVVDTSIARSILSEVAPGRHRRDAANRLWARMALRIPRSWCSVFSELPIDLRSGVIDAIHHSTIDWMNEDVRHLVAADVEHALGADDVSTESWLLAIALREQGSLDLDISSYDLGTEKLTLTVASYPHLLPQFDTSHVVEQLVVSVEKRLIDFSEGRYSMGGVTPEAALGILGSYKIGGYSPSRYIDLLFRVAKHPKAPSESRIAALHGLRRLMDAGVSARPSLQDIRAISPESHGFFGSSEPPEVMEVELARAFANEFGSDEVVARLMPASRHPVGRVRRRAVEVAGQLLHEGHRWPTLRWIVETGLYDRDPAVLVAAIRGLPTELHAPQALRVIDRLHALARQGRRPVRASLAAYVSRRPPRSKGVGEIEELLREDRSWWVRAHAGLIRPD